jgi:DNA repair exonuclease SbcCD ATPase subunit
MPTKIVDGVEVDVPDEEIQPEGITVEVPKTDPAKKAAEVDNRTGEPGRTFTVDDIEKARREEKDKLYPKLQELEAEVERIRKEREEREAAAKAEVERLAAETKAKEEEELSVRDLLQRKEEEWKNQFAQLQQQNEQERALFERERQFQALTDYKNKRLGEEAEHIMPELTDLVAGNSPEEIEASISLAVDKTARILEQIQANTQQFRQTQRGVSVTQPPVGPMDAESTFQTLTADDIQNMSMDDYAKYRDKLMGGMQNRIKERGLY